MNANAFFALPRPKGNEVPGGYRGVGLCLNYSDGSPEGMRWPSEPPVWSFKAAWAAVAFPAAGGRWQSHQDPRFHDEPVDSAFTLLQERRLTQVFLIQVCVQMDFFFPP